MAVACVLAAALAIWMLHSMVKVKRAWDKLNVQGTLDWDYAKVLKIALLRALALFAVFVIFHFIIKYW